MMTIQLIIDFGDVTLAFDDYQKNNGFKIGSFYMCRHYTKFKKFSTFACISTFLFIGVNKRKN